MTIEKYNLYSSKSFVLTILYHKKMKKFSRFIVFIGSVVVLITTGCKEGREESIHSLFILYVSNQSVVINPVDIKITIDSIVYIDQEFEVGDKHNWKEFAIKLEKGPHIIRAESDLADVILEEQFELTNDKHWSVIDYYNAPSRPSNTERFYFEFSDTAIGFM